MARRPRDSAPGVHHVVVGAAYPELYFRDELDHLVWTRRLVYVLDRYDWTCVAFCELSTHLHLLVEIADDSLPSGMHCLSREYGKDYNVRHERVGALVRERYWSRRIDSNADVLGTYAYVVRNPVEAGLVDRPEDWRWSSYATTLGREDAFPFVDATLVLSQLGTTPAVAVAALRAYVSAAEGRVP